MGPHIDEVSVSDFFYTPKPVPKVEGEYWCPDKTGRYESHLEMTLHTKRKEKKCEKYILEQSGVLSLFNRRAHVVDKYPKEKVKVKYEC